MVVLLSHHKLNINTFCAKKISAEVAQNYKNNISKVLAFSIGLYGNKDMNTSKHTQ